MGAPQPDAPARIGADGSVAAVPGGSGATPLVELRGVTKTFGDIVADDDVHLAIAEGEIHALLGENGAGKTTLMRVLAGLTRPDDGDIRWRGAPVHIGSPADAIGLGIGMMHQHDMLVSTLTVEENFELARPRPPLALGLADTRGRVAALTQRYGIDVRPDQRVETLTVGQRQWVNLLRILDGPEVRLLILDEPTASLTQSERDDVFRTLRHLRAGGVAVILIVHKLGEVFEIADRATVMRAGRVVATRPVAETSKEELAALMVGHAVETRLAGATKAPGEVILSVAGLQTTGAARDLVDVSFEVRRGEIVGVAGVDGNGQRELGECLAGIRRPSAGRIEVRGGDVTGTTPPELTRLGVARVPEDRQEHGLALGLRIWENIHLGRSASRHLVRRGVVDTARARRLAADLAARFDVRAQDLEHPVGELSGGNQQKVILARELGDDADLVVAMNPTRGLDISATQFVYEQLAAARSRGGGVLLVSFDLDELLGICDRVLVMSGGRIAGEVSGAGADRTLIGMLMGGEHHVVAGDVAL
ncbi:MAG: ABC transporter ATP-binding protein [Chloroflexi bacterium]|jgi:simple sugar transport system ATP-binding protein|nr:ABC transporter ATP-binding protein [Chloroflexota bacterium]